MAGVFINYRSDAAAWAVVLDGELSGRFGTNLVFRAPRSIRPSEDFIDRILQSVRSSWVLLAVISPTWLIVDKNNRRRIDDDNDWVRREIAEALSSGIPIIPILTDDAAPPNAADLPADIAPLGRCQYLRLHHRNVAYDIQRILDELSSLVPQLVRAQPKRPESRREGTSEPVVTDTSPELTPEALRRLVEKLALLRTMRDAGTRQQIVDSLPLPVALQIRRHGAVLPDVHAIVVVCLEHDAAMDVLLGAVRQLEGPSRSMRELEIVLDDLDVGVTR